MYSTLLKIFGITLLILTPIIVLSESKYDPPKEPFDGLSITIERGDEVTNKQKVLLFMNALNDVEKMAISNTEDFSKAFIEPYIGIKEWSLTEGNGEKAVYVKLYTRNGIPSRVIKDSIVYIDESEPEKDDLTVYKNDLEAEDLFKTNKSNAVYYYGYDNKRYVFPIESIFYSWYTQEDFNTIKVISEQTLTTIPIGGNILYKPGNRLVKIQSDPKVYAVGFGGELYWIKSEKIANNLYGSDWSKKVSDIPVSLFGNYTISYDIDNENILPNAFLFSEKDSKTVFLVDEGMKRSIINQDAFYANGFNFTNVRNIEKSEILIGNPISSKEKRYTDTAQTEYLKN